MGDVTIFHNPRCSKSRQAMALLEERGVEHDVVRYLDEPPSRATIEGLVRSLDGPVRDLVRWDDAAKAGVAMVDRDDVGAVVALLAAHPALLQRPIVVRDGRAVIGRPIEAIEAILDA
jgi:arsenate reductase